MTAVRPYGRVIISKNNAAATEHPLASLAAFETLRAGGTAFDAAVAASFCLSVVQHPHGGIGGDFFALMYQAEKDAVYCLNASGWAPSGLTVEAVTGHGYREMPSHGPYSVTIPGLVKGIYRMHERFGILEFPSLLSHAIEFAENGFPLGYDFARCLRLNIDRLPDSAKQVFLAEGKVPEPGTVVRQQKLGAVLKEIAENGPDPFYDGCVAESLCEHMVDNGISMEIADFRDFEPEWCDPLKGTYRGTTVYEIPPNSMGATTLLMLKMLEEIEMNNLKPNSSERVAVTVKAAEASYQARDESLADPRFAPFDLQRFLSHSPFQNRKQEATRPTQNDDTTYFAIADKEGNIVSGIQSLFDVFGSMVFVEDCGIFLNSRASGFKLSGQNKLEPRKRPLHTLSTLLIQSDHKPTIALGASGGNFRPQQHSLFVTNLVDYSMSLEEAIDFPRFLWHDEKRLRAEEGYVGLSTLPFDIENIRYPASSRETGVAQGVEIMAKAKKAICDVRGDGLPMGN